MTNQMALSSLTDEFRRIKKDHRRALRRTASRVILGSSVIRVFTAGTKDELLAAFEKVRIDDLPKLTGQQQFKAWFGKELRRLAVAIKRTNPTNGRIYPGYKWGHATKILTLYVRQVVLNSRYFSDRQAARISKWLYIPIDRIAIRRLRRLGVDPPFKAIKQINTAAKFYGVQELLGQAARREGVPRIWFDDNWGDRQ